MRKIMLRVVSTLTLSLTVSLTSQVNAANLEDRLAGNNRYQTGAEIVGKGWTTSDYVVIASGEGFADALCAAPLAKKYNAPILLTGKNTLDLNTKNELKRLNVKNVFIVGGTGVVSDSVNSEIKGMTIETTRIAGKNRFQTSLEVAKNLGESSGVVVTNGFGFADALSIAPVAAQGGMPILLTDKADLSDQVKGFLSNKSYEKSYIVGGSGVVSDKIASQLKNVTRLGGSSRYGTNAAVLNQFSNEFNYDKVYVASGANYPDALCGSALAALSNSPLILVGTSVDSSVMSSIKAKHDTYNNVIILGGTGVVSDIVADNVVSGAINVISVTLNKTSNTLGIDEAVTLAATIFPSNAENKGVKWTSSNENIATVDAAGRVTGISSGTAVITATTVEGNKAASCTVTVQKKIITHLPSTYLVGVDIPEGEYVLFPEGSGYFAITADANGRDIINNDNFAYPRYVSVQSGTYMYLHNAKMHPVNASPDITFSNGRYIGYLKVGVDIPTGTYKVKTFGSRGYYAITDRYDNIFANDNFTGDTYITIKDGQYLELNNCYIEK
ncbi:cell wall-binding repeat-containing protein [Clostridium sp. BSD9I1]|uniref:cell wall-binding repeat-containing protein n=1 Tax=Clostridium sp. BSD9I1 TaxID=2003589 RepID=UPI0016490E3E|nr:cell wall-binding repeat-containing protein [Clostridium sp. BSD9I1]